MSKANQATVIAKAIQATSNQPPPESSGGEIHKDKCLGWVDNRQCKRWPKKTQNEDTGRRFVTCDDHKSDDYKLFALFEKDTQGNLEDLKKFHQPENSTKTDSPKKCLGWEHGAQCQRNRRSEQNGGEKKNFLTCEVHKGDEKVLTYWFYGKEPRPKKKIAEFHTLSRYETGVEKPEAKEIIAVLTGYSAIAALLTAFVYTLVLSFYHFNYLEFAKWEDHLERGVMVGFLTMAVIVAFLWFKFWRAKEAVIKLREKLDKIDEKEFRKSAQPIRKSIRPLNQMDYSSRAKLIEDIRLLRVEAAERFDKLSVDNDEKMSLERTWNFLCNPCEWIKCHSQKKIEKTQQLLDLRTPMKRAINALDTPDEIYENFKFPLGASDKIQSVGKIFIAITLMISAITFGQSRNYFDVSFSKDSGLGQANLALMAELQSHVFLRKNDGTPVIVSNDHILAYGAAPVPAKQSFRTPIEAQHFFFVNGQQRFYPGERALFLPFFSGDVKLVKSLEQAFNVGFNSIDEEAVTTVFETLVPTLRSCGNEAPFTFQVEGFASGTKPDFAKPKPSANEAETVNHEIAEGRRARVLYGLVRALENPPIQEGGRQPRGRSIEGKLFMKKGSKNFFISAAENKGQDWQEVVLSDLSNKSKFKNNYGFQFDDCGKMRRASDRLLNNGVSNEQCYSKTGLSAPEELFARMAVIRFDESQFGLCPSSQDTP